MLNRGMKHLEEKPSALRMQNINITNKKLDVPDESEGSSE